MRDEWRGVNLSLLNQAKHFLAIASVHTTGLEGEVLAIHIGQRKHLGLVIKSHHRYNSIRAGTLPCLICRSLEQMLPIVTRTMASVGSINVGFGFSTKANFPFSMYVYANININNQLV